jgi:gag-polypeptide of LTR copia-type
MSEENIGISTSTTTTIIKETIDTNTSVKLTLMLLNRKNYQSWARSMHISLKGKGKLGFINGTKTKTNNTDKDREVGVIRQCDNVLAPTLNGTKYKRALLLQRNLKNHVG